MSITTDSRPEAAPAALQPVLSARFALRWHHALVCLWFGGLFLYLNYIPLFHSDVWGHLHYGQLMLQRQALLVEDPFMPLAEGMRSIDTAWLSQIVLALAERWGGPEGLSTLFAVIGSLTFVLLARAFYLQTGQRSLAVLGTLLVLIVGWTRHAIIRPEIFGGLCCATLLWLIAGITSEGTVSRAERTGLWKPRWLRLWLGIPLLFAAWANLHGSFAVGLMVLACLFVGECLEVAWRMQSPWAPLEDANCRRWLVLTELAVAACLINPYGVGLLIETATFSRNANLKDILEWYPLKLVDLEGLQFAFSWVLLLVAFRHSRRRIRAFEVLLLGVLAASVAQSIRMIGWYAPVAVLVLMPHLADIVSRLCPKLPNSQPTVEVAGGLPRGQSFSYSLVSLLVLWICFALSPSSAPLLGGRPRPVGRLYSADTPLELTDYLRKNPPEGLVWGPQWWGDWLCWSGPPGLKVMATTHIHLIPRRVWQDYMRVRYAQDGWERILDRYHVTQLVVHKQMQPQLTAAVRRSRQWKAAYEDPLGIVLNRVAAAKQTDAGSTPAADDCIDPCTIGGTP